MFLCAYVASLYVGIFLVFYRWPVGSPDVGFTVFRSYRVHVRAPPCPLFLCR